MRPPPLAGEGRFRDLVEADAEITRALDRQTRDAAFDEAAHLRHVNTIFNRVFGVDDPVV